MNIQTSIIKFPGGELSKETIGFLARPDRYGEYPAVIVIHEIWGLVDHMKDVARRFASEGYVTLAVDLFDGETVSNLEKGYLLKQKYSEEKILGDLNGAFRYLKKNEMVNPKRIGCIGFCMGGGLSLLLACHNKELAAAVVFYGRNPSPINQVKDVSCPILGNYAGADMAITEKDVELLRQTLAKYGKTYDLKVYPEMPHAFFNDAQASYREAEAKDAWERTLSFYRKYLGPS